MKVKIFSPAMFVPTKFDTVETKAQAANDLVAFIRGGFQEKAFTPALYKHLSLHLFGHIAHYNRDGFYAEWFSTPAQRLEWIDYVIERPVYGDPQYTWSDVERAFKRWIETSAVRNEIKSAAFEAEREESVYVIARKLCEADQCLTPTGVDEHVQSARRQVEEASRMAFDPRKSSTIRERLVRELLVTRLEFKVATISSNTNAFGLNGYIFVGRDGECWQAAAYRPTCRYGKGDTVIVPARNGVPQFGQHGFEVPERRQDVPRAVVTEVWG